MEREMNKKNYVQIQIPKWVLVIALAIFALVIFGGGIAFAQATADQADITVIYEDDLVRFYADGDYGERIVANKQGGVDTYCPCEMVCKGEFEVKETIPEPKVTPEIVLTPSEKTTPTPGPSATLTVTPIPTSTRLPTSTATPVSPTETPIPTVKSNANCGVGNGVDGDTPGCPGGRNDGPETSPGNPGSKGGNGNNGGYQPFP